MQGNLLLIFLCAQVFIVILFHRRTLSLETSVKVSSLAVQGEFIYWIDVDQQIERADKRTGRRSEIVIKGQHFTDLVSIMLLDQKVVK